MKTLLRRSDVKNVAPFINKIKKWFKITWLWAAEERPWQFHVGFYNSASIHNSESKHSKKKMRGLVIQSITNEMYCD